MDDKLYWYWLSNLRGVGRKTIDGLLAYYKTPRNLYEEKNAKDFTRLNIKEKEIYNICKKITLQELKENIMLLEKRKIRFVSRGDNEYPKRLTHIYDAPYGLYVKGNQYQEDIPSIAIVGARNCTQYGREMARYFSNALAKQGICVVSGLARGIDAKAHEGAVHERGSTLAVLGSGIDVCYPKEHEQWYNEISKCGTIVSEYNVGVKPLPYHFPMRNRIISGLADGIIVIEAREKSGSLITVDYGLDQGKNIYALPGRVTDELSRGSNQLITQGAKLVISPEDILEDYTISAKVSTKFSKKNNNMLETKEEIVYAYLSLIPKHIEQLLVETNLNVEEIAQVLLSLQLKGYVSQTAGNYYRANYKIE